jgi:Rap1a immunity proteins
MNTMLIRLLLLCWLMFHALLARVDAAELAPLTSMELHELCLAYVHAPESEKAQACAAYVRGFIEGSEQIVLRNGDKEARPESFSERAWRTRLGANPPKPRYCLKARLPLREFIAQMLKQAERKPPTEDSSADALLYGTLSRFHRCSG